MKLLNVELSFYQGNYLWEIINLSTMPENSSQRNDWKDFQPDSKTTPSLVSSRLTISASQVLF